MDLFEIRNWFAHNLCDYLREKEEEDLLKLKAVISAVSGEEFEVPENILSEVSEELPIFKEEKGSLRFVPDDPITEEYVREKAKNYSEFLRELPANFEPVEDDIEKNVKMARLLFEKELYFEVHEILEEVWMGEFGKEREFLQALIQIGVAYYHLSNYNTRGFKLLLENALELLESYSGIIHTVNVDKLKEDIKRAMETEEVISF